MPLPIISGIQQVGIGIPDVYEAWTWYRKAFRIDVPVFDEAATAALMLPYTGGEPRDRHAVLALSMQGGGGAEIWQYTSRIPTKSNFEIQVGDLGIWSGKIKSRNIANTITHFNKEGISVLNSEADLPDGRDTFYTCDPYGNYFQLVPSTDWFSDTGMSTGGFYGCNIGVTDVEVSKKFYAEILGYDKVLYDKEGKFEDIKSLPGGGGNFRRVLLTHSKPRVGAFTKLLGTSEIELYQSLDRTPKQIFENRFWGDIGFIHLCFDIQGFADMKALCHSKGHPFTVDSTADTDSFDMGEAAGSFAYIEDPDGTLIEFVETHKVPILKKLNWYIDLKKRNPEKPLPKWMLKTMGLSRKKD